MTRSPLFYPLNRGMDADGGGAAELQTDVMRFMAIISMCLVAIFALVQSIPLDVVAEPVVTQSETPEPVPAPESPAEPEPAISLTRSTPTKPEKPIEQVALQRPALKPVQKAAADAPAGNTAPPAPSAPAEAKKGFSLRFVSDQALTSLVARDVVGLYAIAPGKTQRMNVASGDISFWTASTPNRVHEMDVSTVPSVVLAAYRRNSAAPGTEIKWGVSLPASMSERLNQFLSKHQGGSLVIDMDGTMRMEQ